MKTKKPLISIALVLCGITVGILIWSAVFAFTGFSLFTDSSKSDKTDAAVQNATLTTLAYNVLEYIRDDDFLALSHVVHPETGVVFSPYTTINLSTDRQFSAEQVAMLGSDSNIYIWGVKNGSGEPIELTPAEYLEQYVPVETYVEASIIGINQIIKSGNALENITDVFPNVNYVDFHIPGDESDASADYNWSSLRLGFEEYEGNQRLIVIVHSKWTA
jgi:hypothetical protein